LSATAAWTATARWAPCRARQPRHTQRPPLTARKRRVALALERGWQAEEVLREQLAIKPTPKLLCLLGDIKNEPAHYEEAWELSNHRYTRAQRSLGVYYMRQNRVRARPADSSAAPCRSTDAAGMRLSPTRCPWARQPADAIPCFVRALAINPLYPRTWFTLGCAYMMQEAWTDALNAFSRVVSQASDDGEAWSNIAAVQLRLNRREEAFRALKEALKQSYDNWKIWENMLHVSMDVAQFAESIQALDRLLDLRPAQIDAEVRAGATWPSRLG